MAAQELCPPRTILVACVLKVLLARAIHDVSPTTVVPAAAMQAVPCFPAVLAVVVVPVISALRVVGPPQVGALRVVVPAPRVGRVKGVVPPSPSANRRPWIS
jgi:hypothetical protein